MAVSDVDQLSSLLEGAKVEDGKGIVSFAGRAIKMDKGADAAEIVDAVKTAEELKALVLEGNTMGVEAAELIGHALSKHKEFQRAKWSDMFTGRLKTEIPQALKHLGAGIMASGASLIELDLSDNAFGPIGVEGIADLLRSPSCYSLQELRLNNNGLGPNGGKMLAAVLEETYQASSKAGKPLALKIFVSGRGRLENEGAIALSKMFQKMGSLEFVSMPQNGINPPGITALAQAFAFNPNLKHINLCDNTFTVSGGIAMAETLPKLKNLETLNFESCLIRTGGAKAVARALENDFPNFKELLCSYNEINKSGVVALVENAALIPSIQTLQVDGNCLGSAGKEMILSTLEAIGKSDILSSLSDDEGTEDEEEKEEEEEEDNSTSLTSEKVSPRDYLASPALPALAGLDSSEWAAYVEQELSSLTDEFDIADRAMYLCMKIASPLTTSAKNDMKSRAHSLCDKVFEVISKYQNISAPALCNSILVNLGLIKSENKKFKLACDDLTGPLILVQHIVQQDYFPRHSSKTLHFYLSQSEQKLGQYFQVKHQLLQTLFAL